MANMNQILEKENIENLIYEVREKQVMFDSNLAKLYQCSNGTKTINQAVKRHINRFPERFMFQLTKDEYINLKSQTGTSSWNEYGGIRKLPFVFTEQGIAMLSSVLRTPVAEEISVRIMDAFVSMRKYISNNLIKQQYINNLVLEDHENIKLLQESFSKLEEKKKVSETYYNGQIYDAFSLLVDLVSRAEKRLILIDNYVDVETLNILAKKKTNVNAVIYTSKKTKLSKVDIENFNKQYPTIKVKYTEAFHDRFLILDDEYAYHIGASIKDAGKKCFGINKIEDARIVKTILQRLEPAMEGANK